MSNLEKNIGICMRVGVVCALVCMLFGIAVLVITGNIGIDFYQKPLDIPAVFEGLLQFKAGSFLALGIMFLIFTPILRVIASIFSFAAEHDAMYVIICVLVLLILAVSFVLGISLVK